MPTLQTAAAATDFSTSILREAIDKRGRYDAARLANLIDWRLEDLARYLGKAPSAVSRYRAALRYQPKLAALAVLVNTLYALTRHDLPTVRAWLRTPIRALDNVSPQALIVRGDIEKVDSLLGEIQSGLAL